ncbi:MAG: hypothetical protein JWM80_278 [Cyanobacteria bacterium RYN_339]|nr:hypothetical protein [Cyanobacteria bacterium RYN_339]
MPDNLGVGFKDLVAYQQQHAPAIAPAPSDQPATVSAQTVRDYGRDHGWDQADVASAIVKLDGGDGAFNEAEFDQLNQELNTLGDKSMLDGLYQELLGRDVDPTGLAAWGPKIDALRQQGKSPAEIKEAMRPFVERSPEYQINHADDFVQQAYQQGVGRAAGPEEVASWKQQMQDQRLAGTAMGDLYAATAKAIADSPEGQTHAATQAPPPASAAAGAAGVVPDSGLEGQHGGQCVVFVENQTGHHFPVEAAKQMLDPGMHPGYSVVSTPQPGDIFVSTGGEWGHTGIVKSVNPDGSLVVVDSNSNLDEVIHTHTQAAGRSAGFLRRDPSQATIPQ